MAHPAYHRPDSLDAALALLRDEGPLVLAGGTDIYPARAAATAWMRPLPDRPVLDISALPGLRGIADAGEHWRLGALVTWAALRDAAWLPPCFDGLRAAAGQIGGVQVQNRATLLGNLCNASPAADTTPALLVNEASVEIAGAGGRRRVPVAELCTAPGRTTLREGELVTSIQLPAPAPSSADAYLRLIPRSEMDIAVVGAAVRIALAPDGSCLAARVALGAVAPTAIRVPAAEAALAGSRCDAAALARMVEAVRAAARPIDDKRGTVAYRRHVIGVLARRAAERALERARASQAGPQAPRSGARSEP